mmetsp:Transcript_1430/g.3544  ORF Transcript_1430/g.3544 Transcript_1430/m.3544 type:complete len:120 (-) Transcript_1430:54-413(-)
MDSLACWLFHQHTPFPRGTDRTDDSHCLHRETPQEDHDDMNNGISTRFNFHSSQSKSRPTPATGEFPKRFDEVPRAGRALGCWCSIFHWTNGQQPVGDQMAEAVAEYEKSATASSELCS